MRNGFSLLLIALCLSLVVFSSGCTIEDIFGSTIPNVNVDVKETEETSDVLVIKSLEVYPQAPIYPGSEISLFVRIENKDDKKTIPYTVEIYDPSAFIVLDEESKSGVLLPLGTDLITFNLKAPDANITGNVEFTPTVSLRVVYALNTTTLYQIAVVDMEQIKLSQLTGKTLNIQTTKSIGSGPIKIDMDLIGSSEGSKFIIKGQSGMLNLKVINKGSGDLEGGKIKNHTLTLEGVNIDNELNITSLDKYFKKEDGKFKNNKDIMLIQRETSPLSFKISLGQGNIDIYKTYTLKAQVTYNYSLTGSISIPISSVIE